MNAIIQLPCFRKGVLLMTLQLMPVLALFLSIQVRSGAADDDYQKLIDIRSISIHYPYRPHGTFIAIANLIAGTLEFGIRSPYSAACSVPTH